MTREEKFYEVFGVRMDPRSDCGFFDCSAIKSCEDCPVKNTKEWWNGEYEEQQSDKSSGKWILLDECSNSGYYCSNCQKKLVKEGWSDTVKKIKYCPNCGCAMEQ